MSDFNILSNLMGSLRFSLTSPATLEHLEFNIRFFGFMEDFDFVTIYENLRVADAWNHLDSITTHPGGSQLQQVGIIYINFAYLYEDGFEEPDEDKVLRAVLDGLPLLCTKDIFYLEFYRSRSVLDVSNNIITSD